MNKDKDNELYTNKIFTNQIQRKPSLNKIPKGNIFSKNIPIPTIINQNNRKSLLPSKQSSTTSLKNNSNTKKTYSGKNIPFIPDRNIYSSIRYFNNVIEKKKNKKYYFKKRISSSEKSKSEKNDESSCTSRKNINIDQAYNFKIEYDLLKQNIHKILGNKIENNEINLTNKIMEEIIIKLNKILEKTNKHIMKNENENENKNKLEIKTNINNKEELNKKLLNLY